MFHICEPGPTWVKLGVKLGGAAEKVTGNDAMAESTLIPQILAIDAGGTMTDTFLIDQDGNFVVGKAQTVTQGNKFSRLSMSRSSG